VNGELSYLHGAFIAYLPGGSDDRRVIPFRFNPESISRTVAVEAGQGGGGVEGAAPRAATAPAAEATADAESGALKESFSIQIRLDFADREESVSGMNDEFGVAPEIAAIEELLYPVETPSDRTGDGTQPTHPARERPTVLFVWGRKRVLPVRIASLKIEESVFNNHLNPVRAEIEASLEVLGGAAALAHDRVRAALDYTNHERRILADEYYDKTSNQGTKFFVPPPTK
jgi:hypothetical protein